MKECLVDVLNDEGTVLHVFPIPVEDQNGLPKAVDPEREALKLAAYPQSLRDVNRARLYQ